MTDIYVDSSMPDAIGTYNPDQRDTSGSATSYNLFADALGVAGDTDTIILREGWYPVALTLTITQVSLTITIGEGENVIIYAETNENLLIGGLNTVIDVNSGVLELSSIDPNDGENNVSSASRFLFRAQSGTTVQKTTGWLQLTSPLATGLRAFVTQNLSGIQFGDVNRSMFVTNAGFTLTDCSTTHGVHVYDVGADSSIVRLESLGTRNEAFVKNSSNFDVAIVDSLLVGLAWNTTSANKRFSATGGGTITVTNTESSTQLLQLDTDEDYVAGVAIDGVTLDAFSVANTDTVPAAIAGSGKKGFISVIAYDSSMGTEEQGATGETFIDRYAAVANANNLKMTWASDDVVNLLPNGIPVFRTSVNNWVGAGQEFTAAGIAGDDFSYVEGAGVCPFTLSTTDTNAIITVSNNGTQWNLDSDQRNLQWDTTQGMPNQYLNKFVYGVFYQINQLDGGAAYTYGPTNGYDDMLASAVEDGSYPVTSNAGDFDAMVFNQQRYYEYEFDYALSVVEENSDARTKGFFFFQSGNTQLDDAYDYLQANGWEYSVSQYIDTDTGMKGKDQTLEFASAAPLKTHKGYELTESDSAFRGTGYVGDDSPADLALIKLGLRKLAAYAIANELYVPIQLTHYSRTQRDPDKAKWTSESVNALMEESNAISSFGWLAVHEALGTSSPTSPDGTGDDYVYGDGQIASWPLALQQYLNQAEFSQAPVDTAIRTPQSTGPRKRRRRYTKKITAQTCSMRIKGSDYHLFEDFYDLTLQGGTLPFVFDDPITGVSSGFYCDKYSVKPLGGEHFVISMAWEKK